MFRLSPSPSATRSAVAWCARSREAWPVVEEHLAERLGDRAIEANICANALDRLCRVVRQDRLDQRVGEDDSRALEQRPPLVPQRWVAQPEGGVVVAEVSVADLAVDAERLRRVCRRRGRLARGDAHVVSASQTADATGSCDVAIDNRAITLSRWSPAAERDGPFIEAWRLGAQQACELAGALVICEERDAGGPRRQPLDQPSVTALELAGLGLRQMNAVPARERGRAVGAGPIDVRGTLPGAALGVPALNGAIDRGHEPREQREDARERLERGGDARGRRDAHSDGHLVG